jgi:hypothetical protein
MKSLGKWILSAYRSVALIALYGILAGVAIYVGTLGFYTINTSWIAPTSVAPTDADSLAISDHLVASQNALATLQMDLQRQNLTVADYEAQRSALNALEPALSHAINTEHMQDRMVASRLMALKGRKAADIERTEGLLENDATVAHSIQQDLNAGLITKAAATASLTQLNESRNALTDSNIADVELQGTILEKKTSVQTDIDAFSKQVDLHSQIATLDVEVAVARQQAASDQQQIERIKAAVAVATDTPYFTSASGGTQVYLAFVPYDNEKHVAVGDPLYDCYLDFIGCRYVGTVKHVYKNEEKVNNPIFHTEMRGYVVQLDLADTNVVRSKTLFVGGKPLGI